MLDVLEENVHDLIHGIQACVFKHINSLNNVSLKQIFFQFSLNLDKLRVCKNYKHYLTLKLQSLVSLFNSSNSFAEASKPINPVNKIFRKYYNNFLNLTII